MKKYELTNEIKNLPGGVVLYRIRALKDFADVKAGDLGGFVQSEANLDQISSAAKTEKYASSAAVSTGTWTSSGPG